MNQRQAAFLVAKIAFAIGMITWLLRKAGAAVIWHNIQTAHIGPIILGLCLGLSTIFIAAWRWHTLLGIFNIQVPLKSLICINWVGQFFIMFMPGPTGDDLTRMLYISRLAKDRVGEGITTVLLDRCIGLASVLALSVLCIPWRWSLLAASYQTYLIAVGTLAAGAVLCVFGAYFILFAHPTHTWFIHCLRFMPAHTLRDELAKIWGLLCVNKWSLARVFAAAVGTQLIMCVLFYLAGRAVDISAPLLTWFSFVPIVLATNVLPITLAGLGVREFLLKLFLGVLAGVAPDKALAASAIVFAMMVIGSLLGGVVYIFYRPKKQSDHLVPTSAGVP